MVSKVSSFFSVVVLLISDDEGKTFKDSVKINKGEHAYFIMNNRLIRTKSGRILLPVCHVPDEFIGEEYFEKCGWSEVKIVAVFSLITVIFSTLAYYLLII